MTYVNLSAHRRYIEDALVYTQGKYLFEDIQRAVNDGTCQFWPGTQSAVVTEILTTPQKKILNIFLAGGVMAELEAMWPTIRAWGHSQGCTVATLIGRRGWERTFLTRHGFTPTMVVLESPL